MEGRECESCLKAGVHTPATCRSVNPDYAGYDLCTECAQEYDRRAGRDRANVATYVGLPWPVVDAARLDWAGYWPVIEGPPTIMTGDLVAIVAAADGDDAAWARGFVHDRDADVYRVAPPHLLDMACALLAEGDAFSGGGRDAAIRTAARWLERMPLRTARRYVAAGFWCELTAASADQAGLQVAEAVRAILDLPESKFPDYCALSDPASRVAAVCNGDAPRPWAQ